MATMSRPASSNTQAYSWPRALASLAAAIGLAAGPAAAADGASLCHGRPAAGRIEHAVQLPPNGPNFEAYSQLGTRLGRTYVHTTVRDIVVQAYAELGKAHPQLRFVYGETGLKHGGPMRPHRTHQSGTSLDFMVPVTDPHGKPAALPRNPANRFGYDLEFDGSGTSGALRIDFEAIAEHLHQLDLAARRKGVRIGLVIFDPVLHRQLMKTARAPQIRGLPYMKGKPWIRHDEHYHIDFAVPCAS